MGAGEARLDINSEDTMDFVDRIVNKKEDPSK
jgi:hypothetical protein